MSARIQLLFDRGPREARFFTVLSVGLVLVRSAPFLIWGHIDFDSDQAIVGLMAKHVSEFRRFPLFFYDQNYMLGVQSWIIAPFFWVARPSIAVLKTPLVILNAVAAIVLMRTISSRAGLRPAVGFVAVLPFIVPTPVVSASYLQTLGSSGIEPLLYVLILWVLRSRPVAFGALLAIGFLHREFTMYAVPALALVHALDGSLFTRAALAWAARALAGFAAVWVALDYLRLHLEGLSLILQAQMLGRHACVEIAQLPARFRYVVDTAVPVLFGGTTMPLNTYGLRSSAVVGWAALGWLAGATLVGMLVRLAWRWRSGRAGDVRWGMYLATIGAIALAAYTVTCSLSIGAHPTVRYINLAVLVPIGVFAMLMAREPSRIVRSAAIAAFVLWGAVNLVDNVRVIREAAVHPAADPHRQLTDFLLGHQIRYARASYWDAYVVDFLSNERVIVGSFIPTRIPEYERLVEENRATAVQVVRKPCEGWTTIGAWCIQLPAR
jgi:hypothetical protein